MALAVSEEKLAPEVPGSVPQEVQVREGSEGSARCVGVGMPLSKDGLSESAEEVGRRPALA